MAVKDKEPPKTSNNLEDATLEERRKVLSYTLDKIEKDFGKGAIMKLGDRQIVSLDAISTGALALDLCLGVGGLPRGRVVEIYGPESSGKTTLTLSVIAEAQRNGGIAAFIDAEHAMDPEYAGKIGVKIDELLISQPDTGEQALEITEQLVRSGAVDIVVIDSVAALVPKAEIEGEMGDSDVSGLAQTDCHRGKNPYHGCIYQPVAPEDRCDVRQPGNHHRGERPEVLRQCASGHSSD